ncbi:trehalose-phosphatase [Kumtagia ephedrae]|uniref:Trehalose 6-phosphate phosphatase n=1 Tax=Kumtagia ephedrae TaxID=2116701 RepID=A0A2P7S2N5_9HYPH|nr:trehalose-phosphatase [Mesorhizobium ephedrae]PSJ56704.1 trehalose-phosphatase [Mesorhizobium ephedrae]
MIHGNQRSEGLPPGAGIALFLDIDGTLLEHQPHPDAVKVDDDLRALLSQAASALDGALAFVTGRTVAMVDRVFSPLSLPAAGLYGLEHRLTPDGPIEAADEPADMAAVADALEKEFHTAEGVYFERKGPVLAIHTRAAPAVFPAVRAAAQAALSSLSEGYRIVAGNAGLEFLPIEALKSAAIARFMEVEPFAGRVPVFIGDDVADESGFEYVNDEGGISIRVRPAGPTAASVTLPDVAAVHRWIEREVLAGVPDGDMGTASARRS